MFPTIALEVVFEGAFQDAIWPEPEEGRPIAVLEFVHVKVPPLGIVEKSTGLIKGWPGQTKIFGISFMEIWGWTVTLTIKFELGHCTFEIEIA